MGGNGVARNEAKGVRYIREAAESGNICVLCYLADLNRYGNGVEENKRKALATFIRTSAGGNWVSSLCIGEMCRDGGAVAVNVPKAIHHFGEYAKYEMDEAHSNENRAVPLSPRGRFG